MITTINETRWMFCRGLGSISVTAGGDLIKTDENLNTVSSDFETLEYFQSWIGLHRARTATLLFHSLSGRQRMRDKRQPTPKAGL